MGPLSMMQKQIFILSLLCLIIFVPMAYVLANRMSNSLRILTRDAEQVRQLEDGRSFPIVIGLPEAQAIERRLSGTEIKRPQTHDLLASIIEAMGGKLQSIAITDLQEHTFFAELRLRLSDGSSVSVDSRPSDAIALGISENVPIYVAEHVLDEAMREPPEEPEPFIDDEDDA